MINQKYFYFRFTNNFFKDDAIRNMKHIPIYGYQFIVIYLELSSLSLNLGGYIRIMKYTSEGSYILKLAQDIGEDAKIVEYAMEYFLKTKLVEKIEKEDIILLEIKTVKDNVGKSSRDEDRKRLEYHKRQMLLSGNNLSLTENDEYREYENNSEAKVIESENKKGYGIYQNVFLTDEEINELRYMSNKYLIYINNLDIEKRIENKEYESDFEILKKRLEEEIY